DLHPEFSTSRDLFERLLIDVDMGSVGTTSRVREAIAATQLFLHRYLLDLEAVTLPAGADPDEVRQRLKHWWTWMRNYRIWEANRKVFLYPENYVRPELRIHKTPAFDTLQNDLLQGEITDDAVRKAYKRYLDEYTEVSRLAIAGGYVYTPDDVPANTRRLVMFGRTRTEPRRYYYRSAEFRDGEKLSASWDPWLKVDVQIDAERVDPVHAFGRVFVFWPVVETVVPDDPAKTTIVATQTGNTQNVTAPPPTYRVRIFYSFCNLNQEWVPAQVLAVDRAQPGPISDVSLYIQASRTVPGGPPGNHDSIVVSATYTVTLPAGPVRAGSGFSLTPELYGLRAAGMVPPPRSSDLSRIFAEPDTSPIDPAQVVRFNAPADSQDGPWVSVDHKGGSFLCRPITAATDPEPSQPLRGNSDRLPTTWDRVDAAFELPDGTMYFFEDTIQRFIMTPPDKPSAGRLNQTTADRWGIIGTNLNQTGVVDAVLARADHIYLFSGAEYYRYPAGGLGRLDAGYPMRIDTNTENLPSWPKIDAAFTGTDRTEYFYSRSQNGVVTSAALGKVRQLSDVWPVPPDLTLDTATYAGNTAYLIFGDKYLPVTPEAPDPKDKNNKDKDALRTLAGNKDGLPETPPNGPSAPYPRGVIRFDNVTKTYAVLVDGVAAQWRPITGLGMIPTAITRTGRVDAAYVDGDKLYLTSAGEFYRYTLTGSAIPAVVDAGYPKKLARPVDGVFRREGQRYVISGPLYAPLPDGAELDAPLSYAVIWGNWRALPAGVPDRLTGILDTDDTLFFFVGNQYAAYPNSGTIPRPYELAALPHEIIRLTSSTAYELNRRLLVGGVDALLTPQTQETDELPAFSGSRSDATTIQVLPRVMTAGAPTSSHLDFTSSNGSYYWEIFFHAPLLIAQALNDAQRFEDARRWYEYVFDPTERTDYWRFLPFLAVDVAALVVGCRGDLADLGNDTVRDALELVLPKIEAMAPAFNQARELTTAEQTYLDGLAGAGLD
ncbi:MAG TPA: neuraminidase-like domain-containing protein, partial [Kribbellaceae bacterium]